MIHSASPQSRPAVIVAWFWRFATDGRTHCVTVVGLVDQFIDYKDEPELERQVL